MQVDGNQSCSSGNSDTSDVQSIESFDMFHDSDSSFSSDSSSSSMYDQSYEEEKFQIPVIVNTYQSPSLDVTPPPWYDEF